MRFGTRSRRQTALALVALALGVTCGVWAGIWQAHRTEHRSATATLETYADRLIDTGEEVAAETDDAVRKTVTDGLPFCSDAELAYLRNWVYNAHHVRDIGRVKDGKLYCASGIGRLDPPATTLKPDVEVGGMKVYQSIPLMISEKSRGFVVERMGVAVVLNPAQYKSLDEPPMIFSGWLRVQRGKQILLIHGFGHPMPLTDAEILAAQPIQRNGMEYMPKCTQVARVCVVGAEPVAAMMSGFGNETRYFAITGGVLGGLLAVVFLLFLRQHRSLESQFRRAIRRGGIRVEYQPIVSLSTGKIVAAEALARWNDEAGMPIPPSLFISIAETRGFVRELTRLMVSRALRELGEVLRTRDFRVTLNVAPQDLDDPGLDDFLRKCLRDNRLQPRSLGLEITERSTASHATAVAAIERLKAAGHAVYIDDFGTGYSSLSYLHQLAIDGIKIDRTFTQTVGTEAVTASVVPQVLAMARELDLFVVVEGIETEEQCAYFKDAGAKICGQGWHFGSPMPASAIRERLRRD